MKIRIFKLQGCKFCELAEEAIAGLGVSYAVIDVDNEENRSECDKLEKFFESNRYPKLILQKKNVTVFINPYEGKELPPFGDNVFKYFVTIEDIPKIIKQYQNEI